MVVWAVEEHSDAKPVLKVTYGEVWGPSPLMYSYSVWPSGEVRYEPLPIDYNGVKTRQAKTFRVSPDLVVRAVNHLLKTGFLSLQDEVRESETEKATGAEMSLSRIFITHSQSLTLEFHFDNWDFKTELDRLDIFPWVRPALQKIEKDLGIRRLVE